MKNSRMFLAAVFVLGMVFSRPAFVLAEELDEKNDLGMGIPMGEDSGSLGSEASEKDEVSVISEAAEILDATHPELAAKLRAIATKEAVEKPGAEEPLAAKL